MKRQTTSIVIKKKSFGSVKKPESAGITVFAEPGFSIIELLVALTMMALLGASLLGVIVSGSHAFERLLETKGSQSESRVALSYVTVKLRQNLSADRVSVIPSDSQTSVCNILKIDENSTDGTSLFIYYAKSLGALVEKRAMTPEVDDTSGITKIADISGFDVMYDNEEQTRVRITVSSAGRDGTAVTAADTAGDVAGGSGTGGLANNIPQISGLTVGGSDGIETHETVITLR